MTDAQVCLDLFSGARGWSVGAQRLGVTDLGIENMPEANATADAAGFLTVWDDVWTADARQWVGVDGVIASAPCPTFAQAGNKKGRRHFDQLLEAVALGTYRNLDRLRAMAEVVEDERTAMVLVPLHFAEVVRPRWVALEQVPSVLPVWDAIGKVLETLGYDVWTGKLDAECYGVPQTRTRAILMASLERDVAMPAPTHSRFYPRDRGRLDPGVKPWVSMAEAIGWGATHRPGMTVTGGGTYTGGAEPFGNAARKGLRREQESGRWKGRDDLPEWAYHRPSPTIVDTFRPDIVAAPGWRKPGDPPRQNTPDSVRVTVEEAARLQSFPDGYPWYGKDGKRFLQVGNAIPPLLAEAILRQFV